MEVPSENGLWNLREDIAHVPLVAVGVLADAQGSWVGQVFNIGSVRGISGYAFHGDSGHYLPGIQMVLEEEKYCKSRLSHPVRNIL